MGARISALRHAWLSVWAGSLFAAALSAQRPTNDALSPSACSSDACALRREGRRVLRSAGDSEVLRLGAFGAPQLAPLMLGAGDSALAYARSFNSGYASGAQKLWTGALLVPVVGLPLAYLNDRRPRKTLEWSLVAVAVSAGVLQVWGARQVRRSRNHLSRAIWWYNRDLPRD